MASVRPESDLVDLPASASIALALAIVRSKPPTLTIGDYVDRIRNSFQLDQAHIQQVHEQGTATYWKAEYQRTLSEKLDMEDEILRLKSEIENLKGDIEPQIRCKPPVKLAARPNMQTKRQNPEFSVDSREDQGCCPQPESVGDSEVAALLRQLHGLSSPSAPDRSRTATMTARLATACAHLDKLVSQPEELASRMEAVCECIYSALTQIYEIQDDRGEQFDHACGRIVRVFRAALRHFQRATFDEATRKNEEEQRKKKKHKSNSRAAKSTAIEDEGKCQTQLRNLTRIMSTMFSRLDLEQKSHHLLYEGLACALLDDIGSTLSFLVFFDPQNAHSDIFPVQGMLHKNASDPAIMIAAAELAAPYSITLLRVATRKVRTSRRSSSETKGQGRADAVGPFLSENFLHRIEQRLQNTLMRGVFGDDDEKFKDAFSRAEETDDVELFELDEDTDDENKSEHFIGKVWELLGWDVLAGKLSMSKIIQE